MILSVSRFEGKGENVVQNVEKAYELARQIYAQLGVDTIDSGTEGRELVMKSTQSSIKNGELETNVFNSCAVFVYLIA